MNNWYLFRVVSKIEKKTFQNRVFSILPIVTNVKNARGTLSAQMLTVARRKVLVCSLRCKTQTSSYMHMDPRLTKLCPQK